MRHADPREDEARQDGDPHDDRHDGLPQVPAEQPAADHATVDQVPTHQVPADQVATPPVGVAYGTPGPVPADQVPPPAYPVADPPPAPVPAAPAEADDSGTVLFGAADVQRFRARWRELQADFVDDPKEAVLGADELVGEVMRALTEIVAEHKRQLEGGWRDGAGETEELRLALRRYRAFLDQLLATPSPTPAQH